MRTLILLPVLFSLLIAPVSAILNDAPLPREPSFIPNEVIVKYRPGQSPDELRAVVAKRAMERRTLFGFIRIFFEELQFSIRKRETPEQKLKRLEEADKKAGVVAREHLFKDTSAPTLKNTYLFKLKDGSDVLQVIKLYEGIPGIEYAQPNYLRHIMNENL